MSRLLRDTLHSLRVEATALGQMVNGTTRVTNALLQRRAHEWLLGHYSRLRQIHGERSLNVNGLGVRKRKVVRFDLPLVALIPCGGADPSAAYPPRVRGLPQATKLGVFARVP